MKSSTLVILAAVLAFTNANERTEREAQFNQNYLPGSLSTNINNAGAHPGSFTGQQVFSAGSYANNVAYGRKKISPNSTRTTCQDHSAPTSTITQYSLYLDI